MPRRRHRVRSVHTGRVPVLGVLVAVVRMQRGLRRRRQEQVQELRQRSRGSGRVHGRCQGRRNLQQ